MPLNTFLKSHYPRTSLIHTWPLHWVWDTYLTAMYATVSVDPRLYFTPHSRSFPYTCKLLACTIGSSLQLKSSCLSPKHIVFSVYMNNMHLTNPVSCIGNHPFAYLQKTILLQKILFLINFGFSSRKSAFHTTSIIFDSSLNGLITKKKNGCFSVFPVFFFAIFLDKKP